jgi:hypothetical protein
LAPGKVSAQEWEKIRHRVRFIHDKLDWDSLLASCGVHPDGCEDSKERRTQTEAERLAAALAPREAFARINDLLPEVRRAKKIAEVAEPIAADVYLMPTGPEPSIYDGGDDEE